MLNMLHKMMAMVSRTLRQQGRFLRRQVFDLALTLMIIGGGMLLFLAAMIAGGMTAYATLRPITGSAGALAIITAFLLIASIVMGLVGYHIQSQSDELAKYQGKYQGKYRDRSSGRGRADHDHQNPRDSMDERYADHHDNPQYDGRYDGMNEEEIAYAQAQMARAYGVRSNPDSRRGGPSAQSYAHTPPAGGRGIDELEMAKEYIAMTHDQLNKKLDIVRRNPVTSVGVAMGIGLLMGRSKSLRFVAKSAVFMGGKMLVDRYLSDKKS